MKICKLIFINDPIFILFLLMKFFNKVLIFLFGAPDWI